MVGERPLGKNKYLCGVKRGLEVCDGENVSENDGGGVGRSARKRARDTN